VTDSVLKGGAHDLADPTLKAPIWQPRCWPRGLTASKRSSLLQADPLQADLLAGRSAKP
jgi:hypothetical protein